MAKNKWQKTKPLVKAPAAPATNGTVKTAATQLPVSNYECHYGNVLLWTSPNGGGKLYIAGTRRGADYSNHIGIIDMTEDQKALPVASISGNLTGMKMIPAAMEKNPYVNIPTRDQRAPLLGLSHWTKIAEQVKAYLETGRSIVVVCYGGHGRSGTAAAILLYLMDPQPGDPVARLRKLGCKNMVETAEQLDYVARMTGVPVTETPPKRWTQVAASTKQSAQSSWAFSGGSNSKQIAAPTGRRTFGTAFLMEDGTSVPVSLVDIATAEPCSICSILTNNDPPICDVCLDLKTQPNDDEVAGF